MKKGLILVLIAALFGSLLAVASQMAKPQKADATSLFFQSSPWSNCPIKVYHGYKGWPGTRTQVLWPSDWADKRLVSGIDLPPKSKVTLKTRTGVTKKVFENKGIGIRHTRDWGYENYTVATVTCHHTVIKPRR